MKNKIITGIILTGTSVMSVILAGCGGQTTKQAEVVTKDTLLEKAVDTFAKMESMDADMNMEMDLKMSASGISMEMKNEIDMNAAATKQGSSHLKGETHVSALGQKRELDIESYTVKEGNDLIQYSKMDEGDNEGNWTYTKINADAADFVSEISVSQIADVSGKLKDSFSELELHNEPVTYNNVSCYIMDGMITGEKLVQIMNSSGQEIDEASLENMKKLNIETELYFKTSDETPYAINMDLGKAIENILASQNEQMQGMEFSAETMKVNIIFNSFNSVNDLKVPDDVKNKAVESVDSLDVQSLIGISSI